MEGATRVRVYLPATTTVLRTLVDEGRLPGPHTAFAVTDVLRQHYAVSDAGADTEELEYAALLAAARASLRLLDNDPLATRRRAVIAADVPDGTVTSLDEPHIEAGAVRVTADIERRDVASVHGDGDDAEDGVPAAVHVALETGLRSNDA